ncbi:MAG: D-alanyl-D-alanine carboxypeptidase/D-alanyl-D-alanine-endopeptidase [Pseudomonadota bacterium]|jgi:D-alanyl-D-alanine carboxypeptidase/D-alanyl-D-alanine-endopeptidase (penicillin-binding protein 4)
MKRFTLQPLTYLVLLLVLSGCGTLQQRGALPDPLSALLAQTGIPSTSVALDIRSVDGERLVAHNADVAFKPASVMKLVTTAAALELLGPGYRWITRLHSSAEIINGTLNGDLVIEGGGDPRFAHEDLARLLRRLRWMGVREIRGDLILDSSLFELAAADPAAFDAAPERAYNALPDALLLDAKALSVMLIPDPNADRARLSVEPPMSDFIIDTPAQNDQPCVRWREQVKPVLTERGLRFEGSFPVSCGERWLTLHLHTLSNEQYVDAVFRQLWSELGGIITGSARSGRVPATARELLAWESMTLAEIIRDINKHSNNVMARQLLLSLAANRGSAPSVPEAGAARVLDWMARHRIDTKTVIIDNGSGLSRHERISVSALSSVLQQTWQSPLMPEFIASLPLVGIDGTMGRRLQESSVRGQAHIKTGTLIDVTSIAGYLTARSGRRIIVSCIINDANASAARPGLDALLQWIYDRY